MSSLSSFIDMSSRERGRPESVSRRLEARDRSEWANDEQIFVGRSVHFGAWALAFVHFLTPHYLQIDLQMQHKSTPVLHRVSHRFSPCISQIVVLEVELGQDPIENA